MKTKIICILIILLDVLWLTIAIPAMPQLVWYYHTTNLMITLGMTIYALFALVSTPLLGALSDKYGRKPVLIYSTVWSIISYFTIAFSWNIWIFLLARVINWLSAGNIWTAQSILSDISSTHKDRTINLGIFGVIFWLGFVVGPALWWVLLKRWILIPFLASGILAVLNIIAIVLFLPETNKLLNKVKKITFNVISVFKEMFIWPERYRYTVYGLLVFAIMIYQTSFLLYLNSRFNVSGTTWGTILAIYGVIMMINQWVLLKFFWLKKFKAKQLLTISFTGMILCYAWAFFIESYRVVLVLIWITGLFQWVVRPVFQDIILGKNEDVWLINGNLVNLGNLASIIWPILGGRLIDKNISPFGLVAALMIISYLLYERKKIHK